MLNDIKLLGRIATDLEVKQSKKGRDYCWYTLAVPRRSDHNQADFIHCIAFDNLAKSLAANCQKGRQLLVCGRLEITRNPDKKTGELVTYHAVVSNNIEFLAVPQNQSQQSA